MKKFIFLLLLVFHLCMLLFAQPPAAVSLVNQFKAYHQQSFTEKLYVHTDKQFYLAGEIIWFKIYYLEGTHHKPAGMSKVAYLEVIDKDNKPVVQTTISLSQGSGSGSIQLPFTINSGVFRLRSYTSWMKNFDADFYFEKPVTIVNSLKRLEEIPARQHAYEARFFPEGGNLVQNLESKIAFRVTGISGEGLSCKGVIIKDHTDTIRKFETLQFGMGNFTLLPQAGSNYKAVFLTKDSSFTRPLPEALTSGYVMNVERINNEQLSVKVTTNISGADSVILFVHTRHEVKYVGMTAFTAGTAAFLIKRNTLGEGISHFTVLNKGWKPVCERLYFVRPVQKLSVEALPDKQTFTTREKVNIRIRTTDPSGVEDRADLSVSVYRVDSLQTLSPLDIVNYTWLQSDLKGNIESPAFYFTDTSARSEEASDHLMLTHGWRRFTWQDVVTNKKPEVIFIPELSHHIIHANVRYAETGLPAKNIVSYLSIPGNHIQLYGGETNELGATRYYVKDLFGKNEMIFQVANDTNSRFNIVTRSPFSEKLSSAALPHFYLPVNTETQLLDLSIGLQVQHAFADDNLAKIYHPSDDSSAFYGAPDAEYMLDNYVRFSTMEEVLREYVPEVLVRRRREDFHLIMADGINERFLDDPIILVNGVPVETNKFMQYDPLKVRKLELVTRRYFYGPMTFNGIINVRTYHPDPELLAGLKATIFDYEGIQYKREFYAPVYDEPGQVSNRVPDFRNTLYWSADVMKGNQGKSEISFYTADKKGEYVVVIEGTNSRGSVGAASLRFQVK